MLYEQRRFVSDGNESLGRRGGQTVKFEQQVPLLSTEIARVPQPSQPGLLLLRLVDNDRVRAMSSAVLEGLGVERFGCGSHVVVVRC